VDPNTDLPFTATSLTNGATYTFSVTATNSVGAGPASTSSNSVTPLSTITVPGAPTNLTASAGNTTANLTWTPPPSGGTPINGYAISSTPGGLTWGISPGSTSFTATGLTNGTTYQFTITASNGMGSGPASAPSNPVTPSGAGTVSNLKVYDTSNAASWSIQGNLQVSNLGWGDRPYTLKSIPAGLLGSQWLRTSMLSKTWNNGSMLVSFSIRSQMTVSVAVDTRLGRRPWMDSSWVDSGTQIVDSESTPSHLEVFQKVFPAGTVSLGPNAGSGSTYIQYLVAAQ
jgi:hypothetical protein